MASYLPDDYMPMGGPPNASSPDPTLTDEELAEIERRCVYLSTNAPMDVLEAGWAQVGLSVPRLIVALSASREEVEKLKANVAEQESEIKNLEFLAYD